MFLTELDPRASVKGSRDPLGFQPIWTRFGRQVIGNLTTVTTSLRNFTILLLGLHFADRLIRDGVGDEEERASLFIRFEQLAAYSRYAKHGDVSSPILGIRRVVRRFQQGERLRLGIGKDAQILSNQKTYGIWGLYSVAASASGLCEDQRPTGEAEQLIATDYLPRLAKGGGKEGAAILKAMRGETFEPDGRHADVAGALAALLTPAMRGAEKSFYGDTLVLRTRGGEDATGGRQAELWEVLSRLRADQQLEWGRRVGAVELAQLRERAASQGFEALGRRLGHIQVVEPVLVAGRELFAFVLNRDGATIESIAKDLRATWTGGVSHIDVGALEELEFDIAAATDGIAARRVVDLARTLRAGDYGAAIQLVLDQNIAVMKARGGIGWASLDAGRVKTRLRERYSGLPSAAALRTIWDNSYFLDSLKAVGPAVFAEVA